MKAIIVNCFDTYEDRVDLVHEFFKEQGYDVTVIQSNFRHFKKMYREDVKEDFIFLNSNSYYKNLSVERLFSHYKYAKNAFKIVEELNPDLLYTFVPPNSLAKFASNYKKKHKETNLIMDLIDLWPETMPIGRLKNLFPFTFWGALRDRSLKYANLVITECNLYKEVLSEKLIGVQTETVYLAKRDIDVVSNPQLSDREIHLAYLGSINNIIDIPKIKEIIESIKKSKRVTLHIIGDGERKKELIDVIRATGATVQYHGEIYSPQEKQDIFDQCHFGLNVMKESVCVALTMKSIDYFQHGLPIINNIPADTAEIVEKYGVGINFVDGKSIFKKVEEFNKTLDFNSRKQKVQKLFDNAFSTSAFKDRLSNILSEKGVDKDD